ncbi:hypothetical protein DUI87_23505 [Hirundo rustica rustica]|uniref:Uncharacterized protein n=1 Tax=Hirundo rustica rustica TaxID=333673 RepID=A0A3M0JHE1_HIRRU|nr:hypothetical protein DUI87_23505 [Hirundo rustica rustica]
MKKDGKLEMSLMALCDHLTHRSDVPSCSSSAASSLQGQKGRYKVVPSPLGVCRDKTNAKCCPLPCSILLQRCLPFHGSPQNRKAPTAAEKPREDSEEISEPLPVPKGAPGELERDFGQGPGVTGHREMALSWKRADFGWNLGRNSPCEDWQALAQGAQSSCGCPWIPGSVQGQVGHWGLEQPETVEGVPAHGN